MVNLYSLIGLNENDFSGFLEWFESTVSNRIVVLTREGFGRSVKAEEAPNLFRVHHDPEGEVTAYYFDRL